MKSKWYSDILGKILYMFIRPLMYLELWQIQTQSEVHVDVDMENTTIMSFLQ